MPNKAVDVDPILPETKQGSCRSLDLEEGKRRKVLLDVVALVPPSSESLEDILLPQIKKNSLEGLVSLFWSLQPLTDRHC